jgi:hypothetical protein
VTVADNPVFAKMVSLLERLAPNEGYTQSALKGVRFMRSNRPLGRTPVLYEPSIVIVCQGRKLGFLGEEVYVYDAQHYLILSVPLPFSTETEASESEPMLAVTLRLDLIELTELILAIDRCGSHQQGTPLGIVSTPLAGDLAEAALRLLQALTSPLDAEVLGPAIVREICYRVLTGERGGAMRAALAHQGRFGRVAKALRRIHTDYVNFRTVTLTSPIQYIKSTRLHQARLLMIRDGLTAASASARVGYQSPSQFSRDFKRFFGRSPVDEARDMRASFALSPAATLDEFSASHYS